MKKAKVKRGILITIVTAVAFFAVTVPFRELFQVVSVTEVRPASAFNPVFGLIYGIPGALGCAIGNFIADIMSGYSMLMCILSFFVQLLYGLLPFVVWKSLKLKVRLNTSYKLVMYMITIVLDALITSLLLGVIMSITNLGSVISMTTFMLFLNNYVFCMILGIPIILLNTRRELKTTQTKFSLNERFILIFLLLGIITASIIGIVMYGELCQYISNLLKLWDKVYIYISVDLFTFCLLSVLVIKYAEGNITIPLEDLGQIVSEYGRSANIDKLESKRIIDKCRQYDNRPNEVGTLSRTFKEMVLDIEKYVENLEVVTSEKERISTELKVATQIQADMLPCIFPAFPEFNEFNIYATMNPAKEVGGDFYDFFLVDDNKLGLVMADVSGKGVPAALFMVISKTLIKSAAQSGLSPKEILESVNNSLCENNEAEMFVTVWLGIMDISTGQVQCANAGHEYPAIKRKSGEFQIFKDKHGFVLAGVEDMKYKEYELVLNEGDKLFVYTDGVAEATDRNNQLFGVERMIDSLNSNSTASCKELIKGVREDIDKFVGEAPQFDDITMLCIEYCKKN